jgi:hypothetical protein
MILTKLRIVHPLGHVEFPVGQATAAASYRDENHPGCEIITVTEATEEAGNEPV